MKIMLVIAFLVEGEYVHMDGYLPRIAPNMEVCEERKVATENYLNEFPEKFPHKVSCIKT